MVNNLREFICKVGNKKHDLNIYLEYEQNQKKLNYRKEGRQYLSQLNGQLIQQAKPKFPSCK